MRVVQYNEFIKLPSGTVFCEWEPCIRRELKVKGESIDNIDYIEMELRGDFKSEVCLDPYLEACDRLEKGEEVRAEFDSFGRDGLYDHNRKYVVYDKQDIEDLLNYIKTLV